MTGGENSLPGLGVLLLSGMLTASFPVPMKFSRYWKWENMWLLYATLALVVIPVAIAFWAVPGLANVYAEIPLSGLLPSLLFGFCWGLAQLTFGLAIARVGMAMAFAIVIGLSAVLGSMIPLAAFHPGDLLGRPGLVLFVSAAILAAGLILYSQAGRRRELESGQGAQSGRGFRTGLFLCVFTGCFGSMLNLGFAFGGEIASRAMASGASAEMATFSVWAVVLAAGYLPSLAYTAYLIRIHGSLAAFRKSTGREALLALCAAVLWLFGMLGYGIGATMMGVYGTSIGFALCQTVLLLWSSALGLMAGEWRAATRGTRGRMAVSLSLIIAAMLILGLGTLVH